MLKYGLLAAGGAVIGSLARLQIAYMFQRPTAEAFPWATFLVNVVGALLIGFLAAQPTVMNNESRRHFLVTGVLGGFTTFSALAVDALQLATQPVTSVIYVIGTFGIGILATHVGGFVKVRS
jgi:CrcB protein